MKAKLTWRLQMDGFKETELNSATDETGRFRLPAVPPGITGTLWAKVGGEHFELRSLKSTAKPTQEVGDLKVKPRK